MLPRRFTRMRLFFSILSGLVMILGGLSACSSNQGPQFTNSNPITIGISLSLTKDFAQDGQAMKQGYQLWADLLNQRGGLLGRPVQLNILDDKSDPDQVAKNYETLISQDHVDLVLGPFSSLLTKGAAPVIQKHGYAFIEGAGGAPSVFDKHWNNLFDVSLPVQNNLLTFAYYILSLPPDQRPHTAVYVSSDDPFTFPQVQLVQQLLERGGIRTLFPYTQYPEGNDPTPFARKIAQAHPDMVVLGTLLPDIQTEVKVFKQMHYNPKAMIATAGPDLGQDFVKAVGGVKYTEGVFVPNGWYPQANNFENATMVQAYTARYNVTPDQINGDVAEAFSAGQVLEQAVTKLGKIDNAAIISLLHSGEVFNTVQGTVVFAADGENTDAIAYLFQWQNGQFIPVYPLTASQQNPEYPKPVDF